MRDTIHCLTNLDTNQLEQLAECISDVKNINGTLFLLGNGGSYTNALHWGLDLLKSCEVSTYVLGSNAGLLTAVSNDISYSASGAYELERMCKPHDILVVMSCSGTSDNILRAMSTAKRLGMLCVLVTSKMCDHSTANLTIRVDSTDYGSIEDTHLAILHWIIRRITREA